MSVEKEDYGLTVPEGDEIITHLDLNKAKRQFEKIRTQLVQDIEEEEGDAAPKVVKGIEHSDAYQALHDEGFGYVTGVISETNQPSAGEPIEIDQPETSGASEQLEPVTTEPQVGLLKKFMQDNPEPAIQMLEATNKILNTKSIDYQMEEYDELLCCFAVKQIIEDLSLDYSADQIELTDPEIQNQIKQF